MSDPSSPPGRSVVVADAPERQRYEGRVADAADVAAAYYHRRGNAIVLTHTEVPPALEGRGIGGALARYALDDARRRGLAVRPQCPFIASYIRRHPEYLDLVPEGAREQYGLPRAQARRAPEGASEASEPR